MKRYSRITRKNIFLSIPYSSCIYWDYRIFLYLINELSKRPSRLAREPSNPIRLCRCADRDRPIHRSTRFISTDFRYLYLGGRLLYGRQLLARNLAQCRRVDRVRIRQFLSPPKTRIAARRQSGNARTSRTGITSSITCDIDRHSTDYAANPRDRA